MKQEGLTLLELLIVMALLTILAGFSINWVRGAVKKQRIAKDIKLIFGTLQEARYQAFARKTTCGLVFGNSTFSSFELRCDSNADGSFTDDTYTLLQRTSLSTTFSTGRTKIGFSKEGFTHDNTTIHTVERDNLPEYSCIVVSMTRIKMGTWNVQDSECEIR